MLELKKKAEQMTEEVGKTAKDLDEEIRVFRKNKESEL